MGDRSTKFTPGEQVRVDTRSGESFYGTYAKWRADTLYEHLVRVVLFLSPKTRVAARVGQEWPCTDDEVQACAFVAKPPTSIQGIDQFLEGT